MAMSSSSSSGSGSRGSNGSQRVSRRLLGLDVDNEAEERPSKSIRRIKYCTEFPLPRHLICSGCIQYEEASAFMKAKGDRETTHTASKYLCREPWKQPPDNASDFYERHKWYSNVTEYLENVNFNVRRLQPPADTPLSKESLAADG